MEKQIIKNLIIKSVIKHPKSTYRVVCRFMYGDADGFENVTVDIPKKHKAEVKNLVQVLYDCIKCDKLGRGGFDTIQELLNHYKVSNFEKYVSYYGSSLQENCSIKVSKYAIPIGVGENYFFGSFQSVTVTFFNENGIEYKVTPSFK